MCDPSTSASVMMMILWYRACSTSNSSPMPAPMALIIVRISLFASILSMRAFSTLMILPRSGRIAWNERSRACLAEPPAESPSTRYSSLRAGSLMEQSASLPGSVLPSRRPLRRVRSRALRAALRARAALIVFSTIWRPSEGFSSRNSASFALTVVSTRVRTSVLPSLLLVWPSNCGLRSFDRDERRETLAHVLAGEVLLLLLEEVLLARVVVDRAREGGAEARQMSAALRRVDVVGEREDGLVVGRVPLHRDLDLTVGGLVLEEDDAAVQRVLVAVDVGDEVLDAAGVLERASTRRRRARR